MPVSTICNHNVATVDTSADMVEAARRMRDAHVGDLVVTDNREGRTVRVGMLSVREDNGIEYALREMQRMGVRRVPVVDSKGALSGVLAIDDVVDHLAVQLNHIAGVIRIEQQKEAQTRP